MQRIFMVSLGCSKNLVDAETMLGETLGGDYCLALEPADADIIIINTCGFIQDARDEGRAVIRECLDVKKASAHRLRVVAAGCWAQRAPDEVMAEFPELDAVWGLDIASSLAEAITGLDAGPRTAGLGERLHPREGARLLTTLPSYAYLRLSDGCDNRCHYCAIPLIRGGLKSRRPQAIVEEAKALEDQGARELVIISQDTTAYGADKPEDGTGLADLLERLLGEIAVDRMRILYAHPAHLDRRVMELLVSEARLCGYLDLPIQHTADGVLRTMGRGYGRERVLEILDFFAGKDITLRTTFLLGHPGETEADVEEAVRLVQAGHFRQVGAFAYSPEPGTVAYGMANQVGSDVAARRRDMILEAQRQVAFAWLDQRVGGTEDVLIDSVAGDGWLAGRTRHEAPDADGLVFVKGSRAAPGDIVRACITARDGYDLQARVDKPRAHHGARRGRKKAGR